MAGVICIFTGMCNYHTVAMKEIQRARALMTSGRCAKAFLEISLVTEKVPPPRDCAICTYLVRSPESCDAGGSRRDARKMIAVC